MSANGIGGLMLTLDGGFIENAGHDAGRELLGDRTTPHRSLRHQ